MFRRLFYDKGLSDDGGDRNEEGGAKEGAISREELRVYAQLGLRNE